MVQIYTWAFQSWHSIDKKGLQDLIGLPLGITTDDYKAITGEDAPSAKA